MIREISKVVMIRLWEPEDVKDAQEFILYLGEEKLLGDIPVELYVDSTGDVLELSHIYDVSESALIPLYEKFGEENVRLRDRNVSDNVGLSSDLFRIADALEGIQQSLDKLAACTGDTKGYGRRLYIAGDVTVEP